MRALFCTNVASDLVRELTVVVHDRVGALLVRRRLCLVDHGVTSVEHKHDDVRLAADRIAEFRAKLHNPSERANDTHHQTAYQLVQPLRGLDGDCIEGLARFNAVADDCEQFARARRDGRL